MRMLQFFGVLAAGLLGVAGLGLSQTRDHTAGEQGAAVKTSPYASRGHSDQAGMYVAMNWGVDHLRAKSTSSGELIRFTYRVVDVSKARVLHEKKAEPHMVGLRSHAMLSVPTLENVGQLRQTEALQAGRDYWVLFSNKGNLVKVGDRVDVIIGDFYASALTVE